MSPDKTKPRTIGEYIASFPSDVQEILQKIRATIRKAAPEAEETISYGIPTFKLNGQYLIYFAGYKQHIAIYPVPEGDADFNAAIAAYKSGKGTLQFPLDKPIPWRPIARIVKLSIQQNLARTGSRK